MSSSPPSKPVRFFIFDNDCIQASFSDGAIVSILNDLCFFSDSQNENDIQRNLLVFTRQNVRNYALPALEYLNQHVEHPYLVDSLMRDDTVDESLFFWTNAMLSSVYWSMQDCNRIWSDGLDAGIQIKSREKNCSITLSPNGKLLKIVFPALVRQLGNHLERKGVQTERVFNHRAQGGKYQYFWQTQYFTVHTFPQRWTTPVSMLLIAYAQQFHSNHTQLPDPSMHFDAQRYYKTELPESKQILVNHREGDGSTSQLHENSSFKSLSTTNTQQRSESDTHHTQNSNTNIFHHSVPLHRAIQTDESLISFNRTAKTLNTNIYIEYTPHYTYKFLGDTMVEILTHTDQNCIILIPNQILHYGFNFKSGAPSEKCYTHDGIPENVFFFEKQEVSLLSEHRFISQKFPLRQVVQLGKGFLHTAHAQEKHLEVYRRSYSLNGGSNQSISQSSLHTTGTTILDPPLISSEAMDETQLPDVGTFTIYRDERVRARFVDRTLLTISPQHICTVIDRLGQKSRFTQSSIPPQFLPYMSHALEFKRWALLSEIERHAEVQSLAEEQEMLEEGTVLREIVNDTFQLYDFDQS